MTQSHPPVNFLSLPTLHSRIAEHIGQKIISGELPPGTPIAESRLARELGVGRGSVREAMLMLECRWLVEVPPRRKPVVRPIDAESIKEQASVMSAVLSLCLARCCDGLSDRPDFELPPRSFTTRLRHQSVEAWLEAAHDYIQVCLNALGCHYLSDMLERLMPSWFRLSVIVSRHPDADLLKAKRETEQIWQALANGDFGESKRILDEQLKDWTRLAIESVSAGVSAPN